MAKLAIAFSCLILITNCPAANIKKAAADLKGNYEIATFAGGCFWCIEAAFETLPGVTQALAGYAGGVIENPTYAQVAGGETLYREAVQVYYLPQVISYELLVKAFWRMYDPRDEGGSFYDRGRQYTSAIFYHDEKQKETAIAAKLALLTKGIFNHIVTPIEKFTNFYPAESYHQNYYRKNPAQYHRYLRGSGREDFIAKTWGNKKAYLKIVMRANPTPPTKGEAKSPAPFVKPSPAQLKRSLSRMEYFVTQEDGTEPPFNNRYWNNKQKGIYVDVVSKRPLFSSTHKYRSGTGWPSFYLPLDQAEIVEQKDYQYGMVRVEIRGRTSDSHLGHLFKDGPKPTGLRYCVNSAALEFIPWEKMKERGYENYLYLFK